MHDQPEQPRKDTTTHRPRQIFSWLLLISVFAMIFVDTYRRHSQGTSWASAFGFPFNLDFVVGFVGDFLIPLAMSIAILRYVRRLSPSREKTILARIGWSLYGYLFLWLVIRSLFLPSY